MKYNQTFKCNHIKYSANKTFKQNKSEIEPKSNLTKSFFPLESLNVRPCHAINAVTNINKTFTLFHFKYTRLPR